MLLLFLVRCPTLGDIREVNSVPDAFKKFSRSAQEANQT
jgi:hypothetical protein